MSDATTGVPAANASVSTIPNDSPPSDGAQSTWARASAARFSASSTRPSAVTPRGSASSGASVVLVDADHRQARGHVLAQRLERAQQHRQALALDGLADERDLERLAGRARARAPARRPGGSTTPLGTIRYSPPKKRRAVHAAASETAIRTRRRFRLRREPHSAATACGRTCSV